MQEINFVPEMYTVSWFMNIFSMVFEIKYVTKIWDFALCNESFIVCFAVSLMLELKD